MDFLAALSHVVTPLPNLFSTTVLIASGYWVSMHGVIRIHYI